MTYIRPVRVQSADDLEAAIKWAGANPKNRWYVARMAARFDKSELIPADWDVRTNPAAPRRIASEQDLMDSAMVDQAIRNREVPDKEAPVPDPKINPAPEPAPGQQPVTAAVGKRRKTQKIQTQAGVKRYGAPIGTPIVRKNGKLVADVTKAVRVDRDNSIAGPQAPRNRVRPAGVAELEEGDEISTKDGTELVIISNELVDGKHKLIASDVDGKEHHFDAPPTAKIRLIEDTTEPGDDDPDGETQETFTPRQVAEYESQYRAGEDELKREKITPEELAERKEKWESARDALIRQEGTPDGEPDPEPAPKKKPEPDAAETPDPEPDVPAENAADPAEETDDERYAKAKARIDARSKLSEYVRRTTTIDSTPEEIAETEQLEKAGVDADVAVQINEYRRQRAEWIANSDRGSGNQRGRQTWSSGSRSLGGDLGGHLKRLDLPVPDSMATDRDQFPEPSVLVKQAIALQEKKAATQKELADRAAAAPKGPVDRPGLPLPTYRNKDETYGGRAGAAGRESGMRSGRWTDNMEKGYTKQLEYGIRAKLLDKAEAGELTDVDLKRIKRDQSAAKRKLKKSETPELAAEVEYYAELMNAAKKSSAPAEKKADAPKPAAAPDVAEAPAADPEKVRASLRSKLEKRLADDPDNAEIKRALSSLNPGGSGMDMFAPAPKSTPKSKTPAHDVDIEENVTFGGQTEYFVRVNGVPVFETRKTGVGAQSTADMIAARYRDGDPTKMSELDGAPYLPEADAPDTSKKAASTLDLSGKTDSRGNAVSATTAYRVGRGGKLWLVDSVNDDGTFKLKAAKPSGQRDVRNSVAADRLVDPNAADVPKKRGRPKKAAAAPAPAAALNNTALSALGKDADGNALTTDGQYMVGTARGTRTWQIEKINSDGTLQLAPVGGGPRRRHNIDPAKLKLQVDSDGDGKIDTPAEKTAKRKADRAAQRAAQRARLAEAKAVETKPLTEQEPPSVSARKALEYDLGVLEQQHKALFDVEQEMVRARRINAWGEERAEIQGRIDMARKDFLVAKSDVKRSRREAAQYGIELPDPPDPSLARIVPPKKRERVPRTLPQGPKIMDGSSTDPLYYKGLSDGDLWAERRGAEANGNAEALAAIDAEDAARQEKLDGPNLTTQTQDQLYSLLDAAGEKGDSAQIEKIMKELDRREGEENIANSDDVWERIGMRVRNGDNPMAAEAEETGQPVDAIIRREGLRYLRENYPISQGVPYERAISQAFISEVEADMRRAEGFVRGGEFRNAAGKRAGISEIELWTTTSQERAIRFAEDDLKEYWDNHGGRMTRNTFKDRVMAAIGAPGAGTGQNSTGAAGGFLR